MRKTVYLAGGINGMSDSECKEWRYQATQILMPTDRFNIISPMIRDYRGQERWFADAIVKQDISDINTSDIILARVVNPSWGTGMEIFYANHVKKKRVVLWGCEYEKLSPWLIVHSEASFVTLEEACSYIKGME